MEPLNFCRQILVQCGRMVQVPNLPQSRRSAISHVSDLCRASQKFMLPEGGALILDSQLRGIDDDLPLRMPHAFVALEYQAMHVNGSSHKTVLFCREYDDRIKILPVVFGSDGAWTPVADCEIPTLGAVQRRSDGTVGFRYIRPLEGVDKYTGDNVQFPGSDGYFTPFVCVVLSFLNALACSNVQTDIRHPPKAGKKIKAAFPFDSYHVLTIKTASASNEDGVFGHSHRSPREHLRRGHIRRLQDGRKLWVNATVVNPGVGGKVTKDYRLAA